MSTDAETAAYLTELVVGEARPHLSDANVLANGVVRHLAAPLLDDAPQDTARQVAAMTDHEFWALLTTDPRTAAARSLQRDPWAWQILGCGFRRRSRARHRPAVPRFTARSTVSPLKGANCVQHPRRARRFNSAANGAAHQHSLFRQCYREARPGTGLNRSGAVPGRRTTTRENQP